MPLSGHNYYVHTSEDRINSHDRFRQKGLIMNDVEKAEAFNEAYNMAMQMMEVSEIEPRSALKQAASDCGIAYGDDMEEFVLWAEKKLY